MFCLFVVLFCFCFWFVWGFFWGVGWEGGGSIHFSCCDSTNVSSGKSLQLTAMKKVLVVFTSILGNIPCSLPEETV